MTTRYFKLSDDMTLKGRWLLGAPTDSNGGEIEAWGVFTEGTPVRDPGPLKLPVDVPGQPLDFSLAAFGTPVVHARVATLLARMAPDDVQLLPVAIQGEMEQFLILVATRLARCIDDAACREVERWTAEDEQPEKVGQYRDISGLRIDPRKVGDAKVFRTWGWSIALIVSEEIKVALEQFGATGVRFTEV
ncbi:imm11 family protein [Myxococcus sp. CA040A]|uniref:imm11 family protein n=1 Tax=Myxococcus sp. CA040A TaxID=2741738 RepID=UPI00157A935B|nr:DUF1629 domain-containing protein [Myxococcus sp. CA040A]NTX08592.1 hypothetical protein [Myxococcus sp. CA040A]